MPDNITGAAKIKVLGVGGGGNNAVNRMIDAGIESAEFVAINTDIQALTLSKAPKKIQIGAKVTGGLGAGAQPEIVMKAAEESLPELRKELEGVDLLFIAAGMGGGTGTGAAPVIAKLARDLDILTIAVVTKPFPFEHHNRMANAIDGINKLRNYVDTLLVVPNAKLLEVLPPRTSVVESFKRADDVLCQAVQSLSNLIAVPSLINLDFADVRTVMQSRGLAHMGIGIGKGENRMVDAAKQAISSPMLETSIDGARAVLINITGGPDMSSLDINEAAQLITAAADPEANIIFGTGTDENLSDEVKITVIATGFEKSPAVEPKAAPGSSAPGYEARAERQPEEASAEDRRERPAPRAYEDDEPISPIFERRPRSASAPVRDRVRESDEPYQPERRNAPQRRPRVYQDDYQESRTQSRRGFTPDVPSFMKKRPER